MTEEEALIRAREAAIAAGPGVVHPNRAGECRDGDFDDKAMIVVAKRALLDLDKPLPVDRDLADLRELMAGMQRAGDYPDGAPAWEQGLKDHLLQNGIPTFRAIIQRRIDEARA